MSCRHGPSRCSRQLTLFTLAMPSVMTTFLGQMTELELECFDTVQEVKHKIANAYFRQIGQPGDQMSLDAFKDVSHGFQLDAFSCTFKAPKCFKADDEILDEVATDTEAGDWLLCMTAWDE